MRPVTERFPLDFTNWNMGLITEATPLNFPEGASIDEENFVLDRDGSRRRRLGLDWELPYVPGETGGTLTSLLYDQTTASGTQAASSAIYNFLWENVAEDPLKNILVHQFGNKLLFFDANQTSVAPNQIFGEVQLTLTATITNRFSFASIQGKLVVAIGDQNIRIITYQSSASYTLTLSRLKVRDFWGVDDGYGVDERPSGTFSSTAGALHAYNLYNQGWPPEFFCATEATANPTEMNNGTNADPVSHTKAIIGMFPSNADNIYSAMTFFTSGRKAYFPFALQNVAFGNTPAAKGHYIIDLFDRSGGRSAAYTQDISKGFTRRYNYTSYLKQDQSTGGIKAIASYAGRIFYAASPGEVGGDQYSPHVGTFVLYSQLVDSTTDMEKCYQEADPTAEEINVLVDTDGGYIQIPSAANIKALVPFSSSLLVFADNGVWEIAGGDRGFTATEFQVRFLTNNGAINDATIVIAGDSVFYWSRTGIYAIGKDQIGAAAVQSISEKTIQQLYNDIPYASKTRAVGYYDDVNYRVRWLYQETELIVDYAQSHELILDLSIPAWSKFHFKHLKTFSPYVSGYVPVPVSVRQDNADYKYSAYIGGTSGTYYMSICLLRNTDFRDWKIWDRTDSGYTAAYSATFSSSISSGVDANAFLVTGYIL